MEYEIKPIFLGTIEGDKSGFTYMAFPGTPIVLDVVFFLIKGAPKTILFDTGSWAALMAKYWPGKGVDYQTFEAALAKEELSPEDIDIIVHSHLHHDHVGNASGIRGLLRQRVCVVRGRTCPAQEMTPRANRRCCPALSDSGSPDPDPACS